jgi:hypothetical protein
LVGARNKIRALSGQHSASTNADTLDKTPCFHIACNDAKRRVTSPHKKADLKSAKEYAEAMLSVQERIGSGAEYRKWHRTNLDHTISKAEEAGAIFSFKEPARFHGLHQAFPRFDMEELGEMILKFNA